MGRRRKHPIIRYTDSVIRGIVTQDPEEIIDKAFSGKINSSGDIYVDKSLSGSIAVTYILRKGVKINNEFNAGHNRITLVAEAFGEVKKTG